MMGTDADRKLWGRELAVVSHLIPAHSGNDALLDVAGYVIRNAELWAERLGVALPVKVEHSPFNCDDCPENLVDPDLDDADGPAFLDELIAVPKTAPTRARLATSARSWAPPLPPTSVNSVAERVYTAHELELGRVLYHATWGDCSNDDNPYHAPSWEKATDNQRDVNTSKALAVATHVLTNPTAWKIRLGVRTPAEQVQDSAEKLREASGYQSLWDRLPDGCMVKTGEVPVYGHSLEERLYEARRKQEQERADREDGTYRDRLIRADGNRV